MGDVKRPAPRSPATAGDTVAPADRTEIGAPTEGGASDVETGVAGAPKGEGGLTAAALAEHSKTMPPIGGEAAGHTEGRSEVARSVVAGSAVAPSAVAPSVAPTVRTFRTHATNTKGQEGGQASGLTSAALAAHSATMPPIGGHTAGTGAGTGVKSGAADKSVAGRSVAQSEMTFRTHMTTRSLLVGASVMRELMRSVSPISEPGVNIKRGRRKGAISAPAPSESQSPCPQRKKKKKKKDKKGRTTDDEGLRKTKKLKPKVPRMLPSTSQPAHWGAASPTPAGPSLTPGTRQDTSAAPSHWKGDASASRPSTAKVRGRDDASPCSADSGSPETREPTVRPKVKKDKKEKKEKRKRSASRGGKKRK